ncbi:MAG TPA: hypothetical protein VE476_00920 [Propionibacteriaceae bacterium]|jgi:hypothetical protein|nr:hypothetical protein [Propionibacteriaceae bacterium]
MNLREAFWPLLGNWTGVEQLGPDDGPARAMIVFKLDLQDRAVLQDYRRVAADGTELVGHGVFVVDPVTGGLLWWFFDSTGIPPTPLPGRWSDDGFRLGPLGEHRLWLEDEQLRRTGPGLAGAYRRISGH